MTKKQFELIAKAMNNAMPKYYSLCEVERYDQWKHDVNELVRYFSMEFDRFDANKFRLACTGGKPFWNCRV